MTFESRVLKVRVKTWSRDSYGLFDFESSNYTTHNLSIDAPGLIIRDGNEVQFIPNHSKKPLKPADELNSLEILASVTSEAGRITIKPHHSDCQPEDINKNLWQIVRDCGENSGYQLSSNDIIKLGRVLFKIKEIKINDEMKDNVDSTYQKSIIDAIKQHFDQLNQTEHAAPKSNVDLDKVTAKGSVSSVCRICLGDNNEDDDPFVSPCRCTGSLKYIHLSCLQKWVRTKLNIQENKNLITIYWKNLDCELCKSQFPLNVRRGGQEYSLITSGTRTIGSYLVMESISKDKKPTGIHILDISGTNRVVLGRGHDCDLKITDISVSRMHAVFKMNKGKIYLQDNNSKFGTLVLKKTSTVFDDNLKEDSLQCGRSVLKFTIKKPWLSYLPCFGSKIMNPASSSLAIKNIRAKTMADDEMELQDKIIQATDRIETP